MQGVISATENNFELYFVPGQHPNNPMPHIENSTMDSRLDESISDFCSPVQEMRSFNSTQCTSFSSWVDSPVRDISDSSLSDIFTDLGCDSIYHRMITRCSTMLQESHNCLQNDTQLYTDYVGPDVGQDLGQAIGQDVGKNVGQDDGQYVGLDVGQPVSQVVSQDVDQDVGQLVGQAVDQNICQIVGQVVGQKVHQVIGRDLLQGVGQAVGQDVDQVVGLKVGHVVGQNVNQDVDLNVGQPLSQVIGQHVGQVVGQAVDQAYSTELSLYDKVPSIQEVPITPHVSSDRYGHVMDHDKTYQNFDYNTSLLINHNSSPSYHNRIPRIKCSLNEHQCSGMTSTSPEEHHPGRPDFWLEPLDCDFVAAVLNETIEQEKPQNLFRRCCRTSSQKGKLILAIHFFFKFQI